MAFSSVLNRMPKNYSPMHRTPSGDQRQSPEKEARELSRDSRALQKAVCAPAARIEAERLQGEADAALAEVEVLKHQARRVDLNVWQMEKVKESKKSSKTYIYWMASWRKDGKMRNVHLGSSRKMDAEAARQKAKKIEERKKARFFRDMERIVDEGDFAEFPW